MSEPGTDPTPVSVPCPHFGLCGGCQLQDLSYAAQLEGKVARLRVLLGSFALPELQIHASPPLGYRNRIRLTLREVDGALRAGYLGARSDEETDGEVFPGEARASFVPITECPIAAPLLWGAAKTFLARANQRATDWLRMPACIPDQLELFTNADESRLLLTLFLRTAQKKLPSKLATDFTALCESLRREIPELVGAGIAFLPAAMRSRRFEQPRSGPVWGIAGVNYTLEPGPPLEPLSYWVPRGAFFQVNRFLLPELVALVSRAASVSHNTALAWDLYAGVGLFSRTLAQNFGEITAVEIAEPAATALAQTKMPNIHAIKATTLDFLRAAVLQRERPSLIVLDPPRIGLGAEVCAVLASIAAQTLVYISCSPRALAADLVSLSEAGYFIAELHLFDLFPQTEHIETVVVLKRALIA